MIKNLLIVLIVGLGVEVYAQSALTISDTRSIPTTPSSYEKSFEPHFKDGSIIGLPQVDGNPYYTLIGLRGWTNDNSGGKAHELAFSNNGEVFFRSGYSPNWESWKKLLVQDANGNVGIGTASPTETSSVNGKIRAKEIKVETANWPDYVFEESYQLPDLKETEHFIKTNKHLPGIPSAKEIEECGVSLGEMNAKLLKKVEELTLYLIDLKEENDNLKKG